jgi:hypothetical protein
MLDDKMSHKEWQKEWQESNTYPIPPAWMGLGPPIQADLIHALDHAENYLFEEELKKQREKAERAIDSAYERNRQ